MAKYPLFFAKGWNGQMQNFKTVFITFCMNYTFVVGQPLESKDFAIFWVWNDGERDKYEILDQLIITNETAEEATQKVEITLKKEMKAKVKKLLTARLKSGMITIEQIERMVGKNESR